MADKLAQLEAMAQGGKAGGDAYTAAINNVGGAKTAALQTAAARAGAINAPAAYLAKQAGTLSVVPDAAMGELAANRGAASTARGALAAANASYLSQLQGAQGVIGSQLQAQLGGVRAKAQDAAYSQLDKLVAAQDKIEARKEKATNKADKQRTDENKARVEFAKQDVAADPNISGDTYDTVMATLKGSDDVDTAFRAISSYTGAGTPRKIVVAGRPVTIYDKYQDSDGNDLDIDPMALIAYTLKAQDPDAFGQALVENPRVFGAYAR